MMKQWITPWGDYYVGDRLHSCDIEVTERPPLTKEQEAEMAKEELEKVDKESISIMRSIVLSIIDNAKIASQDVDRLRSLEAEAADIGKRAAPLQEGGR